MIGRFFWPAPPTSSADATPTWCSLVSVSCCTAGALLGISARRRCSCRVLHHSVHVRRRLCHHPAYLRDMFVPSRSAHPRAIADAWSVAGVLGVRCWVNYIRAYQIDNGVPKAQAYSSPCTSLCGLCWWGSSATSPMHAVDANTITRVPRLGRRHRRQGIMNARLGLAWLVVGIPLLWGAWKTLENALKLFNNARANSRLNGVRHAY